MDAGMITLGAASVRVADLQFTELRDVLARRAYGAYQLLIRRMPESLFLASNVFIGFITFLLSFILISPPTHCTQLPPS